MKRGARATKGERRAAPLPPPPPTKHLTTSTASTGRALVAFWDPALSCPELSRHADTIAALDPEHNSWGADTGSPWLNLATPFDGMLTMTNVGRVQSQLSEVGSPLCRALMSDLTDALPKIALPSLVVWGRHDQGLPVATGEEALRLLGTVSERKSVVILEGSGHNSPYDEPEAFAQAVKAFLADTLP